MRIILLLGWMCCMHAAAEEIPAPAGASSQLPSWAVDADGNPWLSWVEPRGDGWVLRGARVIDGVFAAAKDFAAGPDWFINWADTPGLTLIDGELAPYGLIYTHGGRGYALWLHTQEHIVHDDRAAVEHGFFSAAGGWGVWLDGQEYATRPAINAQTQLRARDLSAASGGESVVDERVCDCCGTAAVALPDGALIAYRDRSLEEVRDINVVRLRDGHFEAPRPVHADGWVIRGCPVNGPALAAAADRVAVAWFTAAQDRPRVRVAFAPEDSLLFGPPVDVDTQAPLGRVSMVAAERFIAIVWMRALAGPEAQKDAQIRYAVLDLDGQPVAEGEVARISAKRSSGFPRIAHVGGAIWVAYTDIESGRVRVQEIPMPLTRTQG